MGNLELDFLYFPFCIGIPNRVDAGLAVCKIALHSGFNFLANVLEVFFGSVMIFANFLVDVLYGIIDPRIRLGGK